MPEPRLHRKRPYPKIRKSKVREDALERLYEDFGHRCCYSLVHEDVADGKLEVEHFKPVSKGGAKNKYSNLFLSSGHVNNIKRSKWPSSADRRKNWRFINPCEEADYGEHIFEIKETGELVATSPQGEYQIIYMDLNAGHLRRLRRERTKLRTLVEDQEHFYLNSLSTWSPEEILAGQDKVSKLKEGLESYFNTAIPKIPEPPS